MSLGNCHRCGHALAVMQEPKRVLVGGESHVVDNEGRPVAVDSDGRLQRLPAFVWRVRCTRCSLEHPDHPVQKKLDAEGATPTPPPPPPVFAPLQYSEATGMEIQDRRLSRLENQVSELTKRLDELDERLEAALAGSRGRLKRAPVEA